MSGPVGDTFAELEDWYLERIERLEAAARGVVIRRYLVLGNHEMTDAVDRLRTVVEDE